MLRTLLLVSLLTVATTAAAQDNSCQFANDNECDEARYGGQGYCDDGTDTNDCSLISAGLNNDSCDFANDGECDEYRFGGTGVCQDGSDRTDCEAWVVQRESDFMNRARALGVATADIADLGDNSCRWNNDGECDDTRYGGTGACANGTDASDCLAQVTPAVGDTPTDLGGDNSCVFANDGECDEERYGGGGFCDAGTDTNDCAALAAPAVTPGLPSGAANDSCVFANDGECDELQYGGAGFCEPNTDATDCAANAAPIAAPGGAGGDNSCVFANDGECDELQYGGGGFCEAGTDTNDCVGSGAPISVPGGGGDDSCVFANDGECDEAQYGGTGFCEPNTDVTDCAASGATPIQSPLLPSGADDSCIFANDNECDEDQYGGTGFCEPNTDATDCAPFIDSRAPVAPGGGSADSCQFANDNECDEARYGGGGFCDDGTDTSDCRQLAQGFNDDTCQWANDGECDELRYGGGGQCLDGTDASDCARFDTSPEALARLLDLVPNDIRVRLGDDSCQYSNDGECDDANFGGTEFCLTGTDATDCRALALGGEDSCRWANDGECDEPGIGTDNCTSGTDMTDCADVAFLRNRNDTCNSAFDGICNEPGDGDGACAAFSDTADCLGRSRPAGLENHFFGRDDRMLVDPTQMPWRAIGSLELPSGGCTGTLVGPSLVLTAAHCVTDTGEEEILPLSFFAGLTRGENQGVAKVERVYFDPSYGPETMPAGQGNGTDWALVFLDRPLGDDVGYLDVHELTSTELGQISGAGLVVNQAGYSWDTGDNMSGNVGCRVVRAYGDNSILHECDTAQGDSGSPFLLNVGGSWKVIAVDSQFFDDEDNKTPFAQSNLAVDSRAFAEAVRRAR